MRSRKSSSNALASSCTAERARMLAWSVHQNSTGSSTSPATLEQREHVEGDVPKAEVDEAAGQQPPPLAADQVVEGDRAAQVPSRFFGARQVDQYVEADQHEGDDGPLRAAQRLPRPGGPTVAI